MRANVDRKYLISSKTVFHDLLLKSSLRVLNQTYLKHTPLCARLDPQQVNLANSRFVLSTQAAQKFSLEFYDQRHDRSGLLLKLEFDSLPQTVSFAYALPNGTMTYAGTHEKLPFDLANRGDGFHDMLDLRFLSPSLVSLVSIIFISEPLLKNVYLHYEQWL